MDWPLFVLLMLAPGFVGIVIGIMLRIIDPPKIDMLRKREHVGGKYKSGDIVELGTGDLATISFVGLDFIHIRIKDMEDAKLVLESDGSCYMLPSHSIARIVGHADYLV